MFHAFVIRFCISLNTGHIPPVIPFSTINNIPILVERSNSTLVFLKAACHANSGAERHFAVSSLYI